ncbi:hypothetical protein RvY_16907-4 [Ramazzottius varieornatus]|uniref:Receptor ligand binding region domain-containing protein n=1 Tax=Ramazzottius varieornatus TaxID=947166 RepID=A0A1D1W061_RAMVA|nr:hypothetical protein RvY_16907-4 [Ramazzottius varieornatus]
MGPIMAGKGRIQYYRWRTQNACRFRCVELLTFVKKKMAENRFYHYLQNGTICLLRRSGSGEALRNKEKYPTVVSTAPTDNSGFTSFFKAILLTFSWKTVFLLCDTNDEVTSFYVATCGSVKRLLKGSIPPFSLHDGTFNSALVREPDLAGLLRMTSSRARGTLRNADPNALITP